MTFHAPFAGAPIFTLGRTSAQFILGADPHLDAGTTTTTPPGLGSCERTDCVEAARGELVVRTRHGVDSLRWAWSGGAWPAAAALGDPVAGSTRYALCVRDADGAVFHELLQSGQACDGHACWTSARRALRYDDAASSGVRALAVRRTRGGGASIHASARGLHLAGPLPVVVQLEADTGTCWSARLTEAEVLHNAGTRLRAVRR